MTVLKQARVELRGEEDLVRARQTVRSWTLELGFRILDQTKVVTAASELGRNILRYGGGGWLELESIKEGMRQGLLLRFVDQGPGIADVELALKDGFTSGEGMGLGLGGSKRLMDEFEIVSRLGAGTRVTVVKWK